MLLPGKKHITALRLEVLPDDSARRSALGRATDGRLQFVGNRDSHHDAFESRRTRHWSMCHGPRPTSTRSRRKTQPLTT